MSSESNRAIISLAFRIRDGKESMAKAKRKLDRLEAAYPEPFLPTIFTPKPKPWDKKYLEQLCSDVPFGKTSREYFMHIAEVADVVYRPIRMIKLAIAAIVVLAGVLAIWAMQRK